LGLDTRVRLGFSGFNQAFYFDFLRQFSCNRVRSYELPPFRTQL
jgi:hypothetical protein